MKMQFTESKVTMLKLNHEFSRRSRRGSQYWKGSVLPVQLASLSS